MREYESEELERIAARLKQSDSGARRVAVMALAESALEPGAGRLLLVALHDADPSVRAEAAKVIDEVPAEERTEAPIGAARALADMKDPAAGAALLAALEGASDPFVL